VSLTVALGANTYYYLQGGGHLWVYLNWALGLRALGCRVIWLEGVSPGTPGHERYLAALKIRLEPYGLADSLALCGWSGEPVACATAKECLDLDAAAEADLLLNFQYGMRPAVIGRFRRSALVDIDPGSLQVWMSAGTLRVAPHDLYFTIGETVGRPEARFPDVGLKWEYTAPCVALDWWPSRSTAPDAPFTTVTHWQMHEWQQEADQVYRNDKRSGFLPFLDLPRHTAQPLELALCLTPHEEDDRVALQELGWRVRDAYAVASTPWDYQRYIQGSRGEFSCVKPSCVRWQNAWISDRTLCYLASGKPAVVEYTGPSRFLPDSGGLFRVRDVAEAARCLETVAADYEHQCQLARALGEEYFDARKVVSRVLERALP
jgi:hypothetical protein